MLIGTTLLDWELVAQATSASAAAGLATAGGALLIYAVKQEQLARLEQPALGFTGGVMLAASFFSLVLPGLESAETNGHDPSISAAIVIGALLIGAAIIFLMQRYSPSSESLVATKPRINADKAKRVWIFIAAIVLHNLPEGLAVGVSFGGGNLANGRLTATGIGLQNIPEGLAVALLVLSIGYERLTAFLIALGSGLVEPLMGFVGITIVSTVAPALPFGMGLAAGAMIYVVIAEIIPETNRDKNAGRGNAGFMIGLALMMYLDVTLG